MGSFRPGDPASVEVLSWYRDDSDQGTLTSMIMMTALVLSQWALESSQQPYLLKLLMVIALFMWYTINSASLTWDTTFKWFSRHRIGGGLQLQPHLAE